jgi:peptidoglycan L-alanyl-D-glutamate endopeptidase CwlK
MTFLEQRKTFTTLLGKLLSKAQLIDGTVMIGEVMRTSYQQAEYIRQGKSKTMNSYHLKACAVDIVITGINNNISEREMYGLLAKEWENMHPNCRAGYYWGWDLGHFEFHDKPAPRTKDPFIN